MTETLESIDLERLLESLDQPACEWGTLGRTQAACARPAAWLCTPTPCACLPKYFCEDHTRIVRAEIERRRLLFGVPQCVACNRDILGENWTRV